MKKIYQLDDEQIALISSDLVEAITLLNGNKSSKGLLNHLNEINFEIKQHNEKRIKSNRFNLIAFCITSFIFGCLLVILIDIFEIKKTNQISKNNYNILKILEDNQIYISTTENKLYIPFNTYKDFKMEDENYIYLPINTKKVKNSKLN